jgi:CMP-N-acetylneuraminic acid synthetase/spore coat polysaccharide biosynthesis predicted glycosyltransferase SpsG
MNVLVVIPARGGSKGIPRKNLRALAGKPLLYYSIHNALQLEGDVDVYVSSEDEEILFFAKKFGAKAYKRDLNNAKDNTTLDPVIYEAYYEISKLENKEYDLIVTMQPTSPLLKVESIQKAIQVLIDNTKIDTVISCVNDTHLAWTKKNEEYIPLYKERLNRQYLKPSYKETGGFLITRNSIITENARIGKTVELVELSEEQAIDIDTYADWNLCEYYISHRTIVFSLIGNNQIGLGHVYNCMTLASQILNHRIVFVFNKESELGYKKVQESNYEVYIQESDNLVDDIMKHQPDLVINDCLDTTISYMDGLLAHDVKVMNIEDLGQGSNKAEVVVNAIYPEQEVAKSNHFFGPKYFCIRDEFYEAKPINVNEKVANVLLSFGGVDPNNLTLKTLDAIYEFCQKAGIRITVILGLGYSNKQSLSKFSNIEIHQNVKSISDFMMEADLAFTSAGRTTYELACIGVPSIVMTQNERETTHFFADSQHGFENLGLGVNVTVQSIADMFVTLVNDAVLREKMQVKMLRNDIRSGRDHVLKMINELLA